jgi:hypothetical protein
MDTNVTPKEIFEDIAAFLGELVKAYPEIRELMSSSAPASDELSVRDGINLRQTEDGVVVTITGLLNAAADRHRLKFWTQYEYTDEGRGPILGFHVTERDGMATPS